MNSPMRHRRAATLPASLQRQRGVILVVTLLCLVVMLISAIALLRASDASLVLTGNVGFKRDLVNQGERAFQVAYKLLGTGGNLASSTTRNANSASNNYSACILPSDANGIPLILEDTDANFATATDANATVGVCHAAVATTSNDITDTVDGISVRYVIDRLCAGGGPVSSGACVVNTLGHDTGGTANEPKAGDGAPTAIYRISVRVTGPHNTLTYVQSVVTL